MAEGVPDMLRDAAGAPAQVEVASNIFLPADILFYGAIGVTTLGALMGIFSWVTRKTGSAARSVGNGITSLTRKKE